MVPGTATRGLRWFALALVCAPAFVSLWGCSTDLAVPAESQLGCKTADDCPAGWMCNANLGRCVQTENVDTTAPAFKGKPVVTPAIAKKGGATPKKAKK